MIFFGGGGIEWFLKGRAFETFELRKREMIKAFKIIHDMEELNRKRLFSISKKKNLTRNSGHPKK